MLWASRLVGAVGLVMVAVALLRVWGARETIGWRAVPARVLDRQVPELVLRAPDSIAATPESLDSALVIRVRYQYAAGGRTHVGGAVVRGSRAELVERLPDYRPGAPLVVYYAPAQPWRSALARGAGTVHWAALAGGLLMIVLSVRLAPRPGGGARRLPAPNP